MDKKQETFVLDILSTHRTMSLATIRDDGFPQANTVSYANDGLTLYFVTNSIYSKVKNLQACNKVSLTIDRDYMDWTKIKGLSMGAIAEILTDPKDIEIAMGCLFQKFPALKEMLEPETPHAIIKITPKIISILDYSVEFAYTELFEV
jgi:general stress protein 26